MAVLEGKLFGFLAMLLAGRSTNDEPRPAPNALPLPPPSPLPNSDVPVAPVWPIQPPPALPPFPGPGWEYDEPPSAAVVQRAFALLNSLWARGQGAGTVEMTAGHYVGYKAEMMRNGKKGVTAWRLKRGAAPSPGPFVNPSPSPQAPPQAPPFVPPAAQPTQPVNPFQPAVQVIPTNPSANALDVRGIQQGLATLGYNVAVDGVNGPQTQAAIKAFQRANPPLAVDGIAGPLTKSTLLARLAAHHGSPVTPASSPAAPTAPAMSVRDVQHALNLAGYGPLKEDGIWGAKSAAATRKFQGAHPPLVVDGIAGAQTKSALAAALRSA